MIIHLMNYGMTPHPVPGNVPADWPPGHRWAGMEDLKHVNCDECLIAYKLRDQPVYEIFFDTKGKEHTILCLRCKRVSTHPKDVEQRYCGACHAFLDDIWQPAKKWWLESYKQPL